MNCDYCKEGLDDAVPGCPQCGRTLVQRPTVVDSGFTSPPSPIPEESTYDTIECHTESTDLGRTLSVAGSSSIRSRLRPRSVIEIFRETFRLYGQHWKLFWMVLLVIAAPFHIAAFILEHGRDGSPLFGSILTHKHIDWMLYVPVVLAEISLVRAVSDSYLGRRVTFRTLLTPNSRTIGFAVVTVLTSMLAAFGALVAVPIGGGIVTAILGGGHLPPAEGHLGFFATVLLGGFVPLVWFGLAGVAVTIEGVSAQAAMARSRRLIRRFFWRSAVVLMGALLLDRGLFLGAASLLTQAIRTHFPHPYTGWAAPLPYFATLHLVPLVCLLISCPLLLLPAVLLYYDLRIRKEGFDLQMLAEQLGYGQPDA